MRTQSQTACFRPAWAALARREFAAVEQILECVATPTAAMRREREHLRAKISFVQDRWLESLELLQKARVEFGPHVGLLSDIAACHYLLGQVGLWEASVAELRSELAHNASLLAPDSNRRAHLSLAKFLEEQGHISQALEIYIELASSEAESETQRQVYAAQVVRVLSYFGQSTRLTSWYRMLISAKRMDDKCRMEVEHSLIIAEAHLVGFDLALSRFSRLAEVTVLSNYDFRLIYFDLLEISLLANSSRTIPQIPGTLNISAIDGNELDHFERLLLKLSKNKDFSLEDLETARISLTTFPLIRILTTALTIAKSDELKSACTRQLWLLVCGLDSATRELLKKRLPPNAVSPLRTLFLDTVEHRIACEGLHLNLSKKPLLFAFGKLFLNHESLLMKDIVSALWGLKLDESAYHRLRMTVKRFNDELTTKLNTLPCLEIEGDCVRVAQGTKIVSATVRSEMRPA